MRWISAPASIALFFAAAPALAQAAPGDAGPLPPSFAPIFADPVSFSPAQALGPPVAWSTRWTVRPAAGSGERGRGAVDVARLSTLDVDARGRALPPLRPGVALDPTAQRVVDLDFVRGWPSALHFGAGGDYSVEVTPHAGLGVSNRYGGTAEAGASVSFGAGLRDKVTGALGLSDGDKRFGNRQRWYLFAAASGKAVGLNLVNSGEGLRRSGLTYDQGGFVGQAQAGIGWRKGPMQASFGYVHEKLKSHLFGVKSDSDDRVALTFSFRPR